MRFFEALNRPSTVLLIVGIIIVANVFIYYFYSAASTDFGGAATEDERTSDAGEESTPPQMTEADYLTQVGNIQNESVETFDSSNDKLLRYDILTPDDVAELQANVSALGDYSDQIENLDPPEGYEDQYELFSDAIGELYSAAEIAYRLASDPVSATQDDFESTNVSLMKPPLL
jgi:hypothetical protein